MKERNYGIDLLRCIAMFMIVVLHVQSYGVWRNTQMLTANYFAISMIRSIVWCAVNCYALISGYVLYNSKPKYSRLLELWFEVIFYTIAIRTIYDIYHGVSIQYILRHIGYALFPVSQNFYWYISAYFGMYLLIPALNMAIEHLDKVTLKRMAVGIILLMCIASSIFCKDPYMLNTGVSCLWLCIMYVAGGVLHKYDYLNRLSRKKALVIFCVSTIITTIAAILCENIISRTAVVIVLNYTFPFIIINAVCLVAIFVKTEIKPCFKGIIKWFSAATLGVYIIHMHPLIHAASKELTTSWAGGSTFAVVGKILIYSAVIYVACSLIDMVRIKIFSVLRVKKICNLIEEKFCTIVK